MTEASEFTKKAIEMARSYQHNSIDYSNPNLKETPRTITNRLTPTNIDLILAGLDALELKSKAMIKRSNKFPSETIKSSVTIEKHESIIEDICNTRNAFCDGLN